MHKVGTNLVQRSQHKSPLMQARVWDRQAAFVHNLTFVEENVDVDCSRAAFDPPNPLQPLFNRQDGGEKRLGIEGCLDLDGAVQKPVLIAVADRLGLEKRRKLTDLADLSQQFHSPADVGSLVAQIRAEP